MKVWTGFNCEEKVQRWAFVLNSCVLKSSCSPLTVSRSIGKLYKLCKLHKVPASIKSFLRILYIRHFVMLHANAILWQRRETMPMLIISI
jgi:hypothetical protein